jgi:hypothetical protein
MELQKQKPSSGRGCRRFFKRFFLFALIILVGIFCFLYFGIYDEGVRAGTVVRISKKGIIFKTYEGQLNLKTFGALKGASPFAEAFDFSVAKKREDVVRELEAVALSGERVSLHYIKRYTIFPWRGGTKYYIVEVEREGERTFDEQ